MAITKATNQPLPNLFFIKPFVPKRDPHQEYAITLENSFTKEELSTLYTNIRNEYRIAYEQGEQEQYIAEPPPKPRGFQAFIKPSSENLFDPVKTQVPVQKLKDLARQLTTLPHEFIPHKKIARNILGERVKMGLEEKNVDWGFGEILAYATLLSEGTDIRLVGQDSGRGTFTHRHAILTDEKWKSI